MRPLALLATLALAGVASIAGPFAAEADQLLRYQQSEGLAPITVPISTASAPWWFAFLGVALLLLAGILTLKSSTRARRWIALVCAGVKALLVGGLGIVLFALSYAPAANADGLFALALLAISIPLLNAGAAYVVVAFASRSRGLPWRVAGAAIDAGVSWFLALNVILEGVTQSQPSWGGSVGHLVYDYPQYGSWPLLWACVFGAVWLAATIPVVLNAVPAQWLRRASSPLTPEGR